MRELRYIVVPNWVERVVDQCAQGDLSVLLTPEGLLDILSTNDVSFYFAAQKLDAFVAKEHEQANIAVHLSNLTGGLFAYNYETTGLPAEKQPDVVCKYIDGYPLGYLRLLVFGPRELGNTELDTRLAEAATPPVVRVRSVNEDTLALVVDYQTPELEEKATDRLAENYSRVVAQLRISMSLSEVAALPLFQSYCSNRSIHYRLRRL